jgi:hypothetical protein
VPPPWVLVKLSPWFGGTVAGVPVADPPPTPIVSVAPILLPEPTELPEFAELSSWALPPLASGLRESPHAAIDNATIAAIINFFMFVDLFTPKWKKLCQYARSGLIVP